MLYNLFENRDFVSVFAVALLAEGVDRNIDGVEVMDGVKMSPSSRRAWIEIDDAGMKRIHVMSPSSRRAWIEIGLPLFLSSLGGVALLAEGVDRNVLDVGHAIFDESRPPRGGRG